MSLRHLALRPYPWLSNLLRNDELGHRMLRGTAWVAVSRIVLQVSGLIQIAVLARFLAPADFGLMAIVLLVLQVLETFTAPGLIQALIQRDGSIDEFFPSVFTINVLRGVVLAAAVLASAPVAATFFHQHDAQRIIQASAIIVLVRAFQSPALTKVNRALEFQKLCCMEVTASVLALVAAIAAAAALHTVWALLISLLVQDLTKLAGSYLLAPWRIRFRLDRARIAELHRFGRWVVLGNMISFLSLQLDNIVVGRVLGTTALGLYGVAFRISQLPATQISQTAATVAFPALSTVVREPARFRSLYLRMSASLLLVNMLVTAVLFLGAGPLVHLVLGDGWDASIPVLRILAVAGLLRSFITVGGKVFAAAGTPKYDSLMNSVRLAVFVATIYPLTRAFGLEGAAVSVLISIACVVPMYVWLVEKTVGVTPRDHVAHFGTTCSWLCARVYRLGR